MKRNKFLKSFWQLVRGYWSSEDKWKAGGLLFLVVLLTCLSVFMLVLLNNWYNDFYNALQGYHYELFWPLVGRFAFYAFIYIALAVYGIYLRQVLQLRWRIWMTDRYIGRWMGRQVYYRLQVLGSDMDNPDQRISEDINQFVMLTLQLFAGLLKQVSTLAAFAVVLWNLSGALTVPIGTESIHIYGYMLWFSLLYSVAGTYLAHRVGRELIGLDFNQQRYEADFRFSMMRVRENSESIAFYGGEKPEKTGFGERFSNVIRNYWQLMKRTKLLNFYSNSYAQLAIIVPLIMAAPRYFSGEMQLGGLMQTISAFGRVQDALSYFVESYDTVAQLIAVTRRLSGFTEHMDEVSQLETDVEREPGQGAVMSLQDFDVALPDGRVLLKGLNVSLPEASRVLVTGNSGCGKSTLLRTLAGLWPFGHGHMALPEDARVLFLPQRPYLPLGSLRRAIYYPSEVPETKDERLAEVLRLVGLERLTGCLDTVDDWSRILSLGEQQRIAFARVLLEKPDWLFLDEATSALDEPREKAMYELLQRELPQMSIVSVGHRSTLFAQHDEELRLSGDGNWQLHPIA